MGLMDSLFGNKAAKEAGKNSMYSPTGISAPGFGGVNTQLLGKNGRGGQSISLTQDPTQQGLGQLGNLLSGQSLLQMLQPGSQGPGGYYGLGIPYDPFMSASWASPGASSAFLDPTGAQQFQQMGMGMLGGDYRDIASRETDLLRQQARPYEDLATSRTLDRLMSRGQLGISTTLNDTFRNLNDQFGQQDLGFQLAGLQRADQLQAADRGVGMGLLGLGSQQGVNQQQQLLQALLGLGQTGIAGAETAGNLQNQGFGQLLGKLGAGAGITQQNFQNLMQLLSGSISASSAKSGGNANAGQISAQNNPMGNLWDFAGSALGGYMSRK